MGQVKSLPKNPDEEASMGLKKASAVECNSTVMIYIHRCGLEYKENSSDDKTVAKWNDLLEDLAGKLLPDIEYYQRGIIMASRVFSIIKCCRDDVFRAKIGGSVGKHIGISTRFIQSPTQKEEFNSEFDLYIFLINKKPPFEKIIGQFKEHLETFKQFLPGFCLLSQDEAIATCIDFKIENKLYHLYPAINFVEISEFEAFSSMDSFVQTFITETKRFVQVQKLAALREIDTVQNFQEKRLYFSCLEESSLHFYKNKPRYIRQVMRLLRYWNHNINCHPNSKNTDGNKSRSAMLDLCAMKAALMSSSKTLFDILRKVMELLTDFKNLCIIFQMDDDNNIAEYDEKKISLINGKLAVLMDFPALIDLAAASNKDAVIDEIDNVSLIQKTIFHSMPCVLEPCNPFNNLADFQVDDWEMLKKNANKILVHLDKNRTPNDEMIHEIFENE